MAYAKVLGKSELLITDNYLERTRENIVSNGKVALAVYDAGWVGIKMYGKAEYFAEGKWAEMVRDLAENAEEPAKGAIVVNVAEIVEIG